VRADEGHASLRDILGTFRDDEAEPRQPFDLLGVVDRASEGVDGAVLLQGRLQLFDRAPDSETQPGRIGHLQSQCLDDPLSR